MNFTCIKIPKLRSPLKLVMPGGVTIEHVNLLDIIQPALAGLSPLFAILDAVVGVFEFAKAVPQALVPPDPTALVRALNELAQKVDKLLRLLPQISVPLMLLGLLDALIEELRRTREDLVQLQEQMTRIAETIDRADALDDFALQQIALCAQSNVEIEAANAMGRLEALGALIQIVNLLSGLVGGPTIPKIGSSAGQPIGVMIESLDVVIHTLGTARGAVPVR